MQTAESAVVPTSTKWQLFRSGIADCLIALGIYAALSMAPSLIKRDSPRLWQHEDHWVMDTEKRIDEEALARWVANQPNTSHVRVKHTSVGFQHIVILYQNKAADDMLWPDWKQLHMWGMSPDRTARPVKQPSRWWVDWVLSMSVLSVGVWRIRRALRDDVPILRPFAGHPVTALAWGVLLGAAFSVVVWFGLHALPWYPNSRSAEVDNSVLPVASAFVKATFIVWSWLLAPISEEILIRGAFFGRLAAAGYVRFGVVTSAIVFALMHFDVAMVAPAFVIGLFSAILYLRARSILAPIAFHILWNVMQDVAPHIHR